MNRGYASGRQVRGRFARWLLLAGFLLPVPLVNAATRLQSIDYSQLPGDRLEFVLRLDGPAAMPRDFQTENPDRIVLDLPGVSNGLDRKTLLVQRAGVKSVQAVEAGGRTRVVFSFDARQPYTIRAEGNRVLLTLRGASGPRPASPPPPSRTGYVPPVRPAWPGGYAITRELGNIDFRRGESGEGRLLITLGDPKTMVDIRREGRKVVVRLPDAVLPPRLSRRLDVIDFATPVHYIEALPEPGGAKVVVTPVSDRYEFSSYQSGGLLAVEFRTQSERQLKEQERGKPIVYAGNKLTLNFQDIPVRSVLQILADFTNLNIVASDTVGGNVTLRLQEVPWDQALDLVLKSKGLGKRQEGNIIRVAPLDELNKQEQSELEAHQMVEELEPLRTEIIQINYTKAEELKNILYGTVTKDTVASDSPGYPSSMRSSNLNNFNAPLTVSRSETKVSGDSIMSERGKVTTDPRTNTLIVMDTARNIERIRSLIRELDTPVRQVLIESRIVIATNDFTRELGARLSLNRATTVNTQSKGNTDYANEPPSDQNGVSGNALVDLAATAAAASGGSFGVTFLKVGDYLLNLELSAAQIEGRTEIISTPKVVTADGAQAFILQGQQIPYSQSSLQGVNTQFQNAVLELKVTPHITADENILMDLSVKKDAPGAPTAAGLLIDKRQILTTAQVANGETMVLGGIFEGDQQNKTEKVPFLGDLPGVGFMFRRNLVKDNKRELLVFITPKIIGSALVQR